MALWRREPKSRVLIQSDQGSQLTSVVSASFLTTPKLEYQMSGRGNCHENAVAESFFSLLKRGRTCDAVKLVPLRTIALQSARWCQCPSHSEVVSVDIADWSGRLLLQPNIG